MFPSNKLIFPHSLPLFLPQPINYTIRIRFNARKKIRRFLALFCAYSLRDTPYKNLYFL